MVAYHITQLLLIRCAEGDWLSVFDGTGDSQIVLPTLDGSVMILFSKIICFYCFQISMFVYLYKFIVYIIVSII